MSSETKSRLDVFKNYHSTLADKLSKNLPTPPNKCNFKFVAQNYRHFIQTTFYLTYTTETYIEKVLRGTNVL